MTLESWCQSCSNLIAPFSSSSPKSGASRWQLLRSHLGGPGTYEGRPSHLYFAVHDGKFRIQAGIILGSESLRLLARGTAGHSAVLLGLVGWGGSGNKNCKHAHILFCPETIDFKSPDGRTFPVTLVREITDVVLPVFSLLTSSWPAVHQSSLFALKPSLVISAAFKLPIMQRSLIYETSCVEPPPAHLFLFVSFSRINMD